MLRKPWPLLAVALLVLGCADGTKSSSASPSTFPIFVPSESRVPIPNDLLFEGTEDLTLEVPAMDPLDLSDPQAALGRLDGWSTTAPLTVAFSGPLDASSLAAGVNVRLFEVSVDTTTTPVGGPVSGVVGELASSLFEVQLAPQDPTGATLRILPTAPLRPSTSYMLVLTSGILDADGREVGQDAEYGLSSSSVLLPAAHPFSALQGLTLAMRAAAASAGVDADSIVLTSTFTTQSIGAALSALVQIATLGDAAEQGVINGLCNSGAVICPNTLRTIGDATISLDGFVGSTSMFVPSSPGFGDVHVGGLDLPYFLTAANNPSPTGLVSDRAPLDNPWRARYAFATTSGPDPARSVTGINVLPERTGSEEIPLLVITPNNGSPAPWPVVIFQHGVARDRTDALLVADALCVAGFAVVAIDMPLHGLVDPASPFFEGYQNGGRRERTFGLDLQDNLTGAPLPDGQADESGAHVFNLTNLLVARDNLQQAVVDLAFLRSALRDVDVDLDLDGDLDTDDVYFVGHSLGAVVGVPFVALSPVEATTLAVSGGGLLRLLVNSPSLGPPIQAGLAALGLLPGTPEYEAYLLAAQTLFDGVDPLNYGAAAVAAGNPIHFVEMVGGGLTGDLPDQVFPNSVPGDPLTGSEPLIATMGLADIVGTTAGSPVRGIVRFIEGTHASLLDPTPSAAAYTEIQSQMRSFLQTKGSVLTVFDASVIRP